MRILVLSVDRDDDFGSKAGQVSPFIGREENIEAAVALGLKDPEDSDLNTVLAAVNIYEDLLKKGFDAHIATVCGDVKVGYESDLVLATQLENVLNQIKPDRVVLVSDGAEDEFIYPMITSRVKVDSVRRVWVKQAPTVEGTYYILVKMMQDDKIRKRILTPLGLILAVVGIFALIPLVWKAYHTVDVDQIGVIAEMTWGMLAMVLGFYLIGYAFKVGEKTKDWMGRMGRAVRSGSQMIPFAIITVILFIMGIILGLNNVNLNPNADLTVQAILFAEGVLWMWAFSFIAFETGRFISFYMTHSKVYWPHIVATLTVLASGFIIQGASDASLLFLKQNNVGETIIFLEFVSGFLLAGFGTLLSVTLRSLSSKGEAVTLETADSIEYPEA
jgi:putative membrane protein